MTEKESILKKSLGGGLSGAAAMSFQVTSLMWLRTTMNYQYRHGGGIVPTIKTLYGQGGFLRFYRGYLPAIVIGPLSRFGDLAAYTYSKENFKEYDSATRTLIGSAMSISWRLAIMPVDVIKTTLQVNGKDGMNVLKQNINHNGIRAMYSGATASMSSSLVGYYPWFFTYDYLKRNAPEGNEIVRNGAIGFISSLNSDICSNSLRIIKTNKQSQINANYQSIIKHIFKNEGATGLLFRGLQTKILINGIQGMIFSIMFNFINNLKL